MYIQFQNELEPIVPILRSINPNKMGPFLHDKCSEFSHITISDYGSQVVDISQWGWTRFGLSNLQFVDLKFKLSSSMISNEKVKNLIFIFKNIFASLCISDNPGIRNFSDIYDFWVSKMHFIAPKIESNWTKKVHELFMKMQHTYFSSHRRWYRSRSIRKNCWFWSWQVDEPLWSLNDIVLSPAKEENYSIISLNTNCQACEKIFRLYMWGVLFFFLSLLSLDQSDQQVLGIFFFLDLKLEVVEGKWVMEGYHLKYGSKKHITELKQKWRN